MTKVSRIVLSAQHKKNLKDAFLQALAALQSKHDIEAMLAKLLTTTEVVMFSKRFGIAAMLLDGATYAEIRSEVGVTDYPIIRVSAALQEDPSFRAIIKQLMRRLPSKNL